MHSRLRQLAHFLVRRRVRVLLTIIISLSVDYCGGRILQHNLGEVHDPLVIVGLACALAGCALFAWSHGANEDAIQPPENGTANLIKEPRYGGLLLTLLGLCLLIDDPRNICLLFGPLILLDLVRTWHQEHGAAREFNSTRKRLAQPSFAPPPRTTVTLDGSRRDNWLLRFSNYVPLLIVPVVAIVVIGYAWPFDSLEFHETWEIRCLLISFVGLAIRMLAAGQQLDRSSGRTNQHRASGLNTDGVFSIVRHPRYLGDYCIGLGVVLIPFVWWLPIVYSITFYFYYKRLLLIEERSLRGQFAEKFDRWASVTPAFIPRFSLWRPAKRPFSFRTALKREHTTLLLVIVLHSSVEWLEHLILERRIMLELFYTVLTLTGLTAYVLVRHLTKHTRLLNVPAQ